ncbi:unnamed protein product [Protopolystoma xenopodis]|uniref:Sushi domain-containing protein n=1 Tax=Protopolystoma xenopodis TaxID=117903 RepID=A0A448XHI9_9PLAT|nr:unnamed protein product [Protopolystoma xenopodis]
MRCTHQIVGKWQLIWLSLSLFSSFQTKPSYLPQHSLDSALSTGRVSSPAGQAPPTLSLSVVPDVDSAHFTPPNLSPLSPVRNCEHPLRLRHKSDPNRPCLSGPFCGQNGIRLDSCPEHRPPHCFTSPQHGLPHAGRNQAHRGLQPHQQLPAVGGNRVCPAGHQPARQSLPSEACRHTRRHGSGQTANTDRDFTCLGNEMQETEEEAGDDEAWPGQADVYDDMLEVDQVDEMRPAAPTSAFSCRKGRDANPPDTRFCQARLSLQTGSLHGARPESTPGIYCQQGQWRRASEDSPVSCNVTSEAVRTRGEQLWLF